MQPTERKRRALFRKIPLLSGVWISDLLAFWLFRKRSKELKMVQIDPEGAKYLIADDDAESGSSHPSTGRELRRLEHEHRTLSARGEWYAQPALGSSVRQEVEGYPPCNADWYEEEVTLRFRFSWCAVPRFDNKTCEHELRDDQQLHKLRYSKQHSQLLKAQLEATHKLGEISEVLIKGGERDGRA